MYVCISVSSYHSLSFLYRYFCPISICDSLSICFCPSFLFLFTFSLFLYLFLLHLSLSLFPSLSLNTYFFLSRWWYQSKLRTIFWSLSISLSFLLTLSQNYQYNILKTAGWMENEQIPEYANECIIRGRGWIRNE